MIDEVTYPVMMSDEIDSRGCKKDVAISRLFVQKLKELPKAPPFPPKIAVAAAQSVTASDSAREGVIVSVKREKRFGFIRPAGGGENLFFHVSSLVDCALADMVPHRSVTFQQVVTERGLNAISVNPQVARCSVE